jgi:AraC-like DNA-binding protein
MKLTPAYSVIAGSLFATHESNTDFRMLLLRHCKNGIFISGILGMSAVIIYLFAYLIIFSYGIDWWYDTETTQTIVLWDKLLIFCLSGLLVYLSRIKLSLSAFRGVYSLIAIICGFAILSDDVMNRNIAFSSGYLTLLLLVSASCIPFKPWQMFLLGVCVVMMLYPGLNYLPGLFGIEQMQVFPSQIVHLSMISLVLVGVSWFLYNSRYVTYLVRRKADGFIDSLIEDAISLDGMDNFRIGSSMIQNNQSEPGEVFVSDIKVPSADKVFLDKVKAVIEQHIGDTNFGVEWLAHEVSISPRQLQRRLKTSVGLSAGSLIRIMRLQRSAQLLRQNAGNVSEIAYKVGFNDPTYFSRIFRKMYGVNPSEYSRAEKS